MNASKAGPAPLVAGNERFWTIQEAAQWLEENASLAIESTEDIAGRALDAARKGPLKTRHYPTGAALAGQRAAGIDGAAWYFYAKDFNAWLDAVNLTSHRLPEAPPAALRQVSNAPMPITPLSDRIRLPETLTGERSAPPPSSRAQLAAMHVPPGGDGPMAQWLLSGRPLRKEQAADWAYWKDMPQIALWEGAMLSLNIEPDAASLNRDPLEISGEPWELADGAASSPERAKEFKRRLEKLVRYARAQTLQTTRKLLLEGSETSTASFAALAVELWPDAVPNELRDLASGGPATPNGQAQQQEHESSETSSDPIRQGAGADPLATPYVAQLFALDEGEGFLWSDSDWRRKLADGRTAWLRECRASQGERGGAPATWWPLAIAEELCRKGTRGANPKTIHALLTKRRHVPGVAVWLPALEAWVAKRSELSQFGR